MRMSKAAVRSSLIAGALFCALPAVTASAQARSLTHGGEKRRFIVYTPTSYQADSAKKFPVVLNYHGGGMTMAEQMLYTRMNRTADAEGFIVVYPQGLQQNWNVGFDMSYAAGTDDVGFTEALLDQLQREYRVDSRRVYATGLSRGGFFAQRLGAELSHRIAAVASVGAPLPNAVVDSQRPRGSQLPIGVMVIHGTSDKIVAYEGKAGAYHSARSTYTYWIERNALSRARSTNERVDRESDDGTSISVEQTSDDSVVVALVTVQDGGHTWTGADPFNVGLSIGRTSQDLDLNLLIWRFFSKHVR